MSEAPVPRIKAGRPAFRGRGPTLSRDCARRQGEISHLAFVLLGGRVAALSFLNGVDERLGGRPIDIAIDSADGYARVEQVMRSLPPPSPESAS